MYKDLKFPILIVHRDIKADTVAGQRVREIAAELEQDGFHILPTASASEGRIVASTHHGLACILVAAEGAGDNQRLLQDVVGLIRVARRRAPQLPIFALGEQVTIENAPAEAMADLNELRGILYLFEDTVPFLARQVARAARSYLEGLLPPFSGRWSSIPATPIIPGIRPVTAVAWPFARVRWGRRSTSSSARTPCVPTSRSRCLSWVRCSITPDRWRPPRPGRHATSVQTTRSS